MMEAFRAGGWGMLPTAVMGVLLILAAFLFGRRPAKRRVPLLLCLATLTFLAGLLGTLSGVISTMNEAAKVPEAMSATLVEGAAQSLHNLRLALMFLVVGAILVADGALKIWRGIAE